MPAFEGCYCKGREMLSKGREMLSRILSPRTTLFKINTRLIADANVNNRGANVSVSVCRCKFCDLTYCFARCLFSSV